MRRQGLWATIGVCASVMLTGASVRAEVIIERLSSLVEDAQRRTPISPSSEDTPEPTKSQKLTMAPPTMMGALSLLEGEPIERLLPAAMEQDVRSDQAADTSQALHNFWKMRRLAIHMGNDEAALESERVLEEALRARRALSDTSTPEELELAYLLLLEAVGAERAGAYSSAGTLIQLAALAGPHLPAVHVARAKLAWGGTGDFGAAFDGIASAWVSVARSELLVAYVGTGMTLGCTVGYILALLALGLTSLFVQSRYILVDLQSRVSSWSARWQPIVVLLLFFCLPLILRVGPILTSLAWLTALGPYMGDAQRRSVRGIASLAAGLPYCIWLAADWMQGAIEMFPPPESNALGALDQTEIRDEIYLDIAGSLFLGLSVPVATVCLFCVPLLWGHLWKKLEAPGLLRACEHCGAATSNSVQSTTSTRALRVHICHLCSISDMQSGEPPTERISIIPYSDHADTQSRARKSLLLWTMVWPGTGHMAVGQIGRGFRYAWCAALIWFVWGWWVSPIPWPEPVLVGERNLVSGLLVLLMASIYASAALSCSRVRARRGQHGH